MDDTLRIQNEFFSSLDSLTRYCPERILNKKEIKLPSVTDGSALRKRLSMSGLGFGFGCGVI